MKHVAIRREDYVGGTRESPEVGIFTQAHTSRPPVPWGRIAPGDLVYMKWSGGPVVATARVQGFRQIERCSPEQLRATTVGYRLHGLTAYWESLSPIFFGLTVYLEDERWLDRAFLPKARSRGESWVVLDRPEVESAWLTEAPEHSQAQPVQAKRGKGRGTRTISASLRFEVLRTNGFRCHYCGVPSTEAVLHIDHLVPWSAGGATVLENLRPACVRCNLGKGARRLPAS